MCSTTPTALADVQQESVSALMSAVVLNYITKAAPACSASHSRNGAAVIESDSEQPAPGSGIRTVLSGHSTDAVTAMKCTPQNTIVSASTDAARCDNPSESPT